MQTHLLVAPQPVQFGRATLRRDDLEAATRTWVNSGRINSDLPGPGLLAYYSEWDSAPPPLISATAEEYFARGHRRERFRQRLSFVLIGVLAVISAVLSGLGMWGLQQRDRARAAETLATDIRAQHIEVQQEATRSTSLAIGRQAALRKFASEVLNELQIDLSANANDEQLRRNLVGFIRDALESIDDEAEKANVAVLSAMALLIEGDEASQDGNGPAALRAYRESIDILTANKTEGSAASITSWINTCLGKIDLLSQKVGNDGNLGEAEHYSETQVAIAAQLLATEPDSIEYLHMAQNARHSLFHRRERIDDLDGAVLESLQWFELCDRLREESVKQQNSRYDGNALLQDSMDHLSGITKRLDDAGLVEESRFTLNVLREQAFKLYTADPDNAQSQNALIDFADVTLSEFNESPADFTVLAQDVIRVGSRLGADSATDEEERTWLLNTVGWMHYLLKDHDKAVSLYSRALARKPDDGEEIRFNLGLAYLHLNDAAAARSSFAQGLQTTKSPRLLSLIRQDLTEALKHGLADQPADEILEMIDTRLGELPEEPPRQDLSMNLNLPGVPGLGAITVETNDDQQLLDYALRLYRYAPEIEKLGHQKLAAGLRRRARDAANELAKRYPDYDRLAAQIESLACPDE